MVHKKFIRLEGVAVCLVCLLGPFGLILIAGLIPVEVKRNQDADLSYKLLPPTVDPERRTEQLGDTWRDEPLDLSAFVGMPDAYRDLLAEYVQTVCNEIGAQPLKRKRYYHKDREGCRKDNAGGHFDLPYPDDADAVYDRDVVVPIVILPRPDAVQAWCASTEGHLLGCRTKEESLGKVGSVYGRTLIFKRGTLSVNPVTVPPSPLQSEIDNWEVYMEDAAFFSGWGKLVVSQYYNSSGAGMPDDRFANLGLGEYLLGEFVTVPVNIQNTRLRWVSIRQGNDDRRFLGYSLLDGNGAERQRFRGLVTPDGLAPYTRPLSCDQHQPKIDRHDELLLPTPLAWAPTYDDMKKSKIQCYGPHEEWCMDDWFPAQKAACWVIRETADSKPLQESFALMPASQNSDLPVFFVALFAETEPKQLVQELAVLYQVSAEATLNSPEAMQRLETLYEKVREFQFEAKDKVRQLSKENRK